MPANGPSQRMRIIGFLIITVMMLYAGYGIELTYFKLHFFVLLPVFGLLFLPPMPLKYEPKEIKIIGYISPVIIAIAAVIFSSFWDNYIASKGVWSFDEAEMIGVIGHIPLEEYFWFVDHTLLSSCFVLALWSTRKRQPLPTADDTRMPLRIIGTLIFFFLMAIGLWLLRFDKALFVGVVLAFFCPVIGILWFFGGHILLQQRREVLTAIGLVSLYVLLIDAWAVNTGVWAFNPQFMTGIRLFGVTDWSQIMIYGWATVIVVFPMVFVLRSAEIILLQGEAQGGPIFARVTKAMFLKSK